MESDFIVKLQRMKNDVLAFREAERVKYLRDHLTDVPFSDVETRLHVQAMVHHMHTVASVGSDSYELRVTTLEAVSKREQPSAKLGYRKEYETWTRTIGNHLARALALETGIPVCTCNMGSHCKGTIHVGRETITIQW